MSAHATLNDFLIALPELVLLGGACALMIADLFVKDPRREASFIIAMLVLLACAASTVFVMWGTGGHLIYAFSGLYVADLMAHVLKLCAYLAVAAALVYSRQYLHDRGLLRGEFLTLLPGSARSCVAAHTSHTGRRSRNSTAVTARNRFMASLLDFPIEMIRTPDWPLLIHINSHVYDPRGRDTVQFAGSSLITTYCPPTFWASNLILSPGLTASSIRTAISSAC